jgi:hypothetical protein
MNPWLRVLAAFGVAIAAAPFLKVLPPLIGGTNRPPETPVAADPPTG